MATYSSKFSPTEKKALELAARYHKGQDRIGGGEYITHPIEVAELLFEYGFRGKYVFTAFCHDLLEDTDVTEQEILETCGRFTLEAVRLPTKRKKDAPKVEVDMDAYLAAIRQNDVAYHVKVADRTMNLWSAKHAGIGFQEKYITETEEYYLELAEDSPLFGELVSAYRALKQEMNRQ
ncbi:MAG: HD domain-containing protein [Anaerovoracaceae bacterium]